MDHREQVASFMNSPPQFISFGELQIYGFFADAAGYSKIAITSHRRASSLKERAGTEKCTPHAVGCRYAGAQCIDGRGLMEKREKAPMPAKFVRRFVKGIIPIGKIWLQFRMQEFATRFVSK